MSKDFLYYKVLPGSKAFVAIQDLERKIKIQIKERRALLKKYQANGWYGGNSGLHGLSFKSIDKVPRGWVKLEGMVYKPSGKSKEGRLARAELALSRVADYSDLTTALTGSNFTFNERSRSRTGTGIRIRYLCCEWLGGDWILHVPLLGDEQVIESRKWQVPEGCIPMKASEYWLLKEAEEAKKPVKKTKKKKA